MTEPAASVGNKCNTREDVVVARKYEALLMTLRAFVELTLRHLTPADGAFGQKKGA